jgi:hypothetical protein
MSPSPSRKRVATIEEARVGFLAGVSPGAVEGLALTWLLALHHVLKPIVDCEEILAVAAYTARQVADNLCSELIVEGVEIPGGN